jgi:Beta-propeller repeat
MGVQQRVVCFVALAASTITFFLAQGQPGFAGFLGGRSFLGLSRSEGSSDKNPTLESAAAPEDTLRPVAQGKLTRHKYPVPLLDPSKYRSRAVKAIDPGLAPISIPITFEPNVGQTDPRAQFVGRGKGLTVLLMRGEIDVRAGNRGTVGIRFETASEESSEWRGRDKLASESDYFIGNDPRKWRTRVPHFARVEMPGAAHGIGLSVYGNDEGMEYDLRLNPGADISKLRLALTGVQHVRLSPSGDLFLTTGGSEIRMKKPAFYEQASTRWHSTPRQRHRATGSGGPKTHTTNKPRKLRDPHSQRRRRKRHATIRVGKRVSAEYVLEADGSVSFRIGPHDPGAALVIDPSLSVSYATFLGGAGTDTATGLAVDSTGKIYVGGTTTSESTFPETSTRLGPADGPAEFFIAKINPAVTGPGSLVYLTFLGGSGIQAGGSVAVDSLGNVAITGTTTSTDFPVTDLTGPTDGLTSGYGNDVIVSEIDPTGAHLVFSTLFGGSGAQSMNGTGGIALASSGNVYISSDTNTTPLDSGSTDLPVTTGAFQTTWAGEPSDGFLAIFQPPSAPGGAATLTYCSYLGTASPGAMGVGGIAVDQSGNAYIAGFAASSGSFPSKNAFQASYGGGASDAFLMKISPLSQGLQDLIYATLIGGSGNDQALAVAVDALNTPKAYVTGTTQSSDFPIHGAVGAYQAALHASAKANAFLTVVAQDALSGQTSLAYSTYLGGSAADAGQGIAVIAQNAVYLTGQTTSWDFPWHDNLQPFNGAGDAFVAKLDPTSSGSASLIYATPLGGTSPAGASASATGNGIAADTVGHVYVAGATTSGGFPTAVTTANPINGFQSNCSSCGAAPAASDAFAAEISESASASPSVSFSVPHINFPVAGVGPQFAAVLNGGEAPLVISAMAVTGANAGDFSLSGQSACIGPSISPGPAPQCSFEVGFTPSTAGPESALLSVTDNAPGSPQVLELTGASAEPIAALSAANFNFGTQPENTSSSGQTITLSNTGGPPLTLSRFDISGSDIAQFSEATSTCLVGIALPSGGSCTVQVVFKPVSTGAFHAELDFFDNSGGVANTEQVVPLTGIGTAPSPVASILPSALGFGSQVVNVASAPQSVTLTNRGSTALSLTAIGIMGANSADFAIASGTTCPGGGTLAIAGTCTVAIQFTPHALGTTSIANLDFADNASGSPQQVTLSGTGMAAPDLVASPQSLNFGSQSLHTGAKDSLNVEVSNQGSTSAGIGTVSFSPMNQADFAVAGNTCTSLAPNGNCQITIAFQPATTGPRAATLNVPGAQPRMIALAGTGTQAAISLPTSFAFPPQLAGTTGSPQPITVTNSSSGPYAGALTVNSVSKTGTNAGDFVLMTDGCTGQATPPAGSCAIQVAYKPAPGVTCGAGNGARSGVLNLVDNAPGSPHSVPLSGTAMEFCLNAAPGQGVSEPITAGQSATFNLEIDSSGGFAGAVQLGCTNPPPSGTCTATPASVQVSPSTPGPFQVVVTSTAPGAATGGGAAGEKGPPLVKVRRITGTASLWIILSMLAWSAAAVAWANSRKPGKSMSPIMPELAVLVLALAMVACSGGGGSSSVADPVAGTPTGTYTVMVTASVTVTGQPNVQRTLPITITVQ